MNNIFTVMWTIPDPNYNYNYTVILTNLNTNMTNHTVMGNKTPCYTVPRLDQTENFNVSVATVNMCGEKRSDPITVFSKSVSYIHTYIHTYIRTYIHTCV